MPVSVLFIKDIAPQGSYLLRDLTDIVFRDSEMRQRGLQMVDDAVEMLWLQVQSRMGRSHRPACVGSSAERIADESRLMTQLFRHIRIPEEMIDRFVRNDTLVKLLYDFSDRFFSAKFFV